jgi:hypothetical protein
MPHRTVKPLILLGVILATSAAARAAAPPRPSVPQRAFEQRVVLGPLGDADVRLHWQLPAQEYARLRYRAGAAATPGPLAAQQGLIDYFNLAHLNVAADDLAVSLDDANREITATFRIQGWARTTGIASWAVEVLDHARWYEPLDEMQPPMAGTVAFSLEKSPPGVVRFSHGSQFNGLRAVVRVEVQLPAGASRGRLFKRPSGRWAVGYRLARPAASRVEEDGEVEIAVEPRREVMPALHKLYGDPLWTTYFLARTRLTNATGEAIRDVRLRARVSTSAGRMAWSDWEEVAAVVHPGQTVQYPLHAVLEAAALMLTSQETARLSVEVEHTRGGQKAVAARTARLTVLGRNDRVTTVLSLRDRPAATFYHRFQEDPVVTAAFITPHDQVVKDLKGQLSRHIGGLPIDSDEGAYAMAKAIYDYFRANLSYSNPMFFVTDDGTTVQHINYPRNVLKAGSGTCIDLAVTYASVAEAAGLHAGVISIPRHAFPYVVMPRSRRLLYIESTCCGKGTLEGSLSFADALRRGKAHLEKSPPLMVTNLRLMRKHVSAPELPPGVPGSLKDWGRTLPPTTPSVSFGAVKVRHNITRSGVPGMQFVFPVRIAHGKDQSCEVLLDVKDAGGKAYLDRSGKPHLVRVTVRPDADDYAQPMTIYYPYEHLAAPQDGAWHERKLSVWAWSPLFKEYVAKDIVTDRLLVQRAAAKEGEALARSILFQTRQSSDAKGKKGLEVLLKDVQLGTPGEAAGLKTTVVALGAKGEELKTADGKRLQREADRVGPASLFFAEEEVRKVGPEALKGLSINFWDKAKGEWLMSSAVKVVLKAS